MDDDGGEVQELSATFLFISLEDNACLNVSIQQVRACTLTISLLMYTCAATHGCFCVYCVKLGDALFSFFLQLGPVHEAALLAPGRGEQATA